MKRKITLLVFTALILVISFTALSYPGRAAVSYMEEIQLAESLTEPEVTPTPSPSPTPMPTPEPTPEPFVKPVPKVLEYCDGVEAKAVRYVSQLNNVEENGWGKYAWKAGMECTTACISMALSYLGIDASPEEILDYSSKTIIKSCYGLDEQIEYSPFSATAIAKDEAYPAFLDIYAAYEEDETFSFSPVVLYFYGAGHYHAVLVIGRAGEDSYYALDPTVAGVHVITISEENEITTDEEEEYLYRYTNRGETPAMINTLGQWVLR